MCNFSVCGKQEWAVLFSLVLSTEHGFEASQSLHEVWLVSSFHFGVAVKCPVVLWNTRVGGTLAMVSSAEHAFKAFQTWHVFCLLDNGLQRLFLECSFFADL